MQLELTTALIIVTFPKKAMEGNILLEPILSRCSVVPGGRIELPLSCENQILSLARLPVPPSGQGARQHDIFRGLRSFGAFF